MKTTLKPTAPSRQFGVLHNGLKFDAKKCLDYIDEMEDFTIEFERKPCYDEESATFIYTSERIKVRAFLKTFLMKCREESVRSDYDFLKWLKQRRHHWKDQQYRVIGSLKDRLLAGEEGKAELERKLTCYRSFFRHNLALIDMIEADVMNDGLPDINALLHEDSIRGSRQPGISSFDRLFNEGVNPEPFYQLLRDHEYPLMGKEYNYVSKALKSGFCIWIYELQRQHVISHQPDTVYADLLIKKMEGLSTFDVSLFRKTNNKAQERYGEYFRRKIAEMGKSRSTTADPSFGGE